METFLIKAAQLIVALSFLVIIHEFGHYVFARIFGIKVEKFYLFFNPWFSLFKYKPKKASKPRLNSDGSERATWRDTEYGIGWLPLGGYVKIAGMIDESMDKEQLAKPAQPWEFRSKPAYQRLLVMIGGVLFNFILAILIYAGIAFWWGEKHIPLDKAYAGMAFNQTAREAGFRDGDILLSADGKKLDASEQFMLEMAEARVVDVLRGKDTVSVNIPENFVLKLDKDTTGVPFVTYRMPVVVASAVSKTSIDAGLVSGDRIVSVDSVDTPSFTEFTEALHASAGREVMLGVVRDGSRVELPVTPDDAGKIGIQLKPITEVYPTVSTQYGFFSAFPKGWQLGTDMLSNYVGSMKYVFTKEGAQSLGGFGAIGSIFPEKWNWLSFWEITAFLSVALAFMNIIPIPALDGGHVMFLLYEMITRRKLSDKVMEYAQMAGMAFLIILLLYANGNDIFRFFFK
ncbi:MAG: RIP metalloprotease RseP [Pseudoflavonifractor sp.]|nr:RIP metalloprotease RseP [Pseudoflavonifractor sp.]